MLGLATTSAASAALLLNLEGLATMAIAWLVFRENVDRRLLFGAAAILAGAVVLSWQGGPDGLGWGAAAIVGACIAWGIDNNLTRPAECRRSGADRAGERLVAGTANLVLAVAAGASLPPIGASSGAALIGFLGYGVSLVLFVLALRHLGAARTGAYFSTAPFIGAVLAVGLLGEPVTPQLVGAAALMAIGLYLHLAEVHAHEHAHEALEHEHRHVHDEHHRHRHDPGDPAGEPHSHRHRHQPLCTRTRIIPTCTIGTGTLASRVEGVDHAEQCRGRPRHRWNFRSPAPTPIGAGSICARRAASTRSGRPTGWSARSPSSNA